VKTDTTMALIATNMAAGLMTTLNLSVTNISAATSTAAGLTLTLCVTTMNVVTSTAAGPLKKKAILKK
jgi:hypothetical protein